MDPSGLANPQWSELGKLLVHMWILLGLVLSFATTMLIGHIFIPSLVATYHLPSILQKTRPLFYAMSVVIFGLTIYVGTRIIDFAGVLDDFWADYWI